MAKEKPGINFETEGWWLRWQTKALFGTEIYRHSYGWETDKFQYLALVAELSPYAVIVADMIGLFSSSFEARVIAYGVAFGTKLLVENCIDIRRNSS